MSPDGSVTHWLNLLKAGDSAAAQPIWERYSRLLVARARTLLRAAPRRVADEEDVVLSAFESFCRNTEQGRFPRLEDRDDLWSILLMLTARKAANQIRDERRAKRGGGKVAAEVDLAGAAMEDGEAMLAQVIGSEPTPEFAAQVAEDYRRLLDKLGDNDLRAIAVSRMEGYTVDEIAAKLKRSPRAIHRKLVVIRDLWEGEGELL